MEPSSDLPPVPPGEAPIMWPRNPMPFYLILGIAPFLVVLLVLWLLDALGFLFYWIEFLYWIEWLNAHAIWLFLFGFCAVLAWLARYGENIAKSFDFYLRTADFSLNRTRGGWLRGYSSPIVLWTTIALFVVVFGPTGTWFSNRPLLGIGAIATMTGLLTSIFARLTRAERPLRIVATSMLLAAIVATVIWLWCRWNFFAGVGATWSFPFTVTVEETSKGLPVTQADYVLYPHTFLVFIGLVSVLACGSRWLACWMLQDFKDRHPRWIDQGTNASGLLTSAEMSVSPGSPALGVGDVLRSAFTTPLGRPHLFLFPVAVAIFLAPHAYMNVAAVVSALAAIYFLALAGVHKRLDAFLTLVQRNFFQGVLRGVSFLVIVLAACRFFEISYVATLMNSASNSTLIWFVVALYATLWFYKYWAGYTLCEHLLGILHPKASTANQVPYDLDPIYKQTSVFAKGRALQIHGSRFAAVGAFPDSKGAFAAWEFYDRFELFQSILERQPGNPKDHCKTPTPQMLDREYGLSDLRQRIHFYDVILDTAVAIMLIALLVVPLFSIFASPLAELAADHPGDDAKSFDLENAIFAPQDKSRPVVLFAASGGGTRAALYSAAVLRGLDDLGALDDVKLCSGVSGGSTAIAHLAIDHAQLQKPEAIGPDPPAPGAHAAAWKRYAEGMTAPFIDNVLCGALETRVAYGTRLGTLLDESFHRHLELSTPAAKRIRLSDAKFGIIFNTTLAGVETDPSNAGSRLIVTNVKVDAPTFPREDDQFAGFEKEFLRYVVVTDPTVPVTTGAALSANFPPVFSNALVALKAKNGAVTHHWVTDGGAAENRGVISLLFVLKRALEDELEGKKRTPSAIQIVIAEASGVSLDFSQDRGIGSALGASEKFASQLTQELLVKIKKDFEKLGGKNLDVHFLPMPLVLRSNRGGIGTHWKLPARITIENPKVDPKDEKRRLILTDIQTQQLIMDLFVTQKDAGKDARGKELQGNAKTTIDTARTWIEGEAPGVDERFHFHRKNWQRLVETFADLRKAKN
jgi:hypothetical protein